MPHPFFIFSNARAFEPIIARQNSADHRFWVNNNLTEIIILQEDITKIKVDAIVNGSLSGGVMSGVDFSFP